MKKIIVEHEYDGYKIGDYLKEVHEYSSRRLRNVEVFLNGKKVKNNAKKIRKLNRITIVEKEKSTGIVPIDMDLSIAYEDENLLIINKEPFIIVHPTQKKVDKTLANGVVAYFLKTMGKIIVPRFFNRLDMNTSGLIIVTKNSHSQTFLTNKGNVKKTYKAVVHGLVGEDEFFIEKCIGRVGDDLRRIELSVEAGGQTAKTFIKVLKRYEERNITLVEAELFTGRTHQIRAHLSLIGHTIVGDELYGSEEKSVKRQLLHSYKLEFNEAKNNERIKVEIDIAEDMKKFLQNDSI